jgi:hypothetical protein
MTPLLGDPKQIIISGEIMANLGLFNIPENEGQVQVPPRPKIEH